MGGMEEYFYKPVATLLNTRYTHTHNTSGSPPH